MSGTEEIQQTTAFSTNDESMDVTPSITAISKKSSEDHNSGSSAHKIDMDAKFEVSVQAEARHSNQNFTNASVCVPMRLEDAVPYHVSPRMSLPAEASSSMSTSKPSRLSDMPLEVRLKIYEFVVGGNQRIYVQSDINYIIPSTIIPCSDHDSIGCLPKEAPNSRPEEPQIHCHGTVKFSRMLCASYEAHHATRQSISVSHDMQTGKQQTATNNLISNQSKLCKHRDTCAGCVQDLRLFRTCRQIYDEARLVLYRSNTFVFLDLATFAAYFGLIFPTHVNMARSTEPNRLRAIQSMTKVELRDHVGCEVEFRDFLAASRLVRMGLGCLTSLKSLELNLRISDYNEEVFPLNIDDCMFSKPSSLRKLVVDLQNSTFNMGGHWFEIKLIKDEDQMKLAEELMRRMLKQKDFCDKTECFWDNYGPLFPLPDNMDSSSESDYDRLYGLNGEGS